MIFSEVSSSVYLLNIIVRVFAIFSLSESHVVSSQAKTQNGRTSETGVVVENLLIQDGRDGSKLSRINIDSMENILKDFKHQNISKRSAESEKKPKSFYDLEVLNVTKFDDGKSLLSKHQHNYRTNRRKHRKHHHRYRHTKRKKIDSNTNPTLKRDIEGFDAAISPTISFKQETGKYKNKKLNPKARSLNKEIQRKKLVQKLIENFYSLSSLKEIKADNNQSSQRDPPSWLRPNLKQHQNQSKENKFSHQKNKSNSVIDEVTRKGISFRNESTTNEIRLLKSNETMTKQIDDEKLQSNFRKSSVGAEQTKNTQLNTEPFIIPGEHLLVLNNNIRKEKDKDPSLFPDNKSTSLKNGQVINNNGSSESLYRRKNQSENFNLADLKLIPEKVDQSELSFKSPKKLHRDQYLREPFRLFIKKKTSNIRIRKSKDPSIQVIRNLTTLNPIRYMTFYDSYRTTRNGRDNKTKGFLHPTKCREQFSFATKEINFASDSDPIDEVNSTDHHEPCYTLRDLFLVILMTSLVNLLAGIVITFAFCCLPLRECCFFAYGNRIPHHGQGICSRNHQDEDISASVGCLEACLPDISYQRHIARGFSKGRAFGMAHMFHQLTGSSGEHCAWDRKPRRMRKDSLLISRRSLSLEDLSAT